MSHGRSSGAANNKQPAFRSRKIGGYASRRVAPRLRARTHAIVLANLF